MELLTPLETLCRLIIRARELEAQVPANDPDEDPDNVDDFDDEEGEDQALSVLQDELNTGVEDEMRATLDDLADDQLAETLALAWVGRGTYDVSEWEDACAEANDIDPESRIDELLDMPLLASHLEAGLAAFDYSCDGVGQLD
ncbi:MAG TPA: DUF3775 domain-containing protein [Allosphingosinicella sp.]|uniref:DUF3775 domain-containing protein n=1 Tax=Allosphingosinicella sp. TaxID=2823234 RepID=UPI002EDAD2B5